MNLAQKGVNKSHWRSEYKEPLKLILGDTRCYASGSPEGLKVTPTTLTSLN